MKCFSRHQSAVTLSSCEAELVALQSGVQEGIGLLRTLGFVLGRLYPWVDIIPQDAQVTWYDEAESDDEDSMKVSYLFPLSSRPTVCQGKCFSKHLICNERADTLRLKFIGSES